METVLSSISKFLAYHAGQGVAPDLLRRWTPEMETQVNVSSAGGTPVEGKRGSFTDGNNEWWPIRVPKNADSEPYFHDYKLDWPLDLYADAIGSTGWDWANKRSRWVGFDFDDLTGHAAGVGVTDEQLEAVRTKAMALPYVEVRRSTGGKGLHLYVMVDVPTENHTVHAGLARAILGMMSAETGFDFSSRIDCCGGNMWIWRKNLLTPGSTGLQLIKAAETKVKPPVNWRDNIDVVTKKRSKVQVAGGVESLAQARKSVELDDQHKALIDALDECAYVTNWAADHHLLQTHTKALAEIFEAQSPPIRGLFSTTSLGNHPDEPNCFMFPIEDGGWRVFRFNEGTAEAITWQQDGKGWTTCDYNMTPSLRAACLAFGGAEDDRHGDFTFRDHSAALKAMAALGQRHTFPEGFEDREVRVGQSKDGRLTVSIKKEKDDVAPLGYVDARSNWRQVCTTRIAQTVDEAPEIEYDGVIRQLVSPGGGSVGWMICRDNGDWREASKDDCKSVLVSHDVPKAELDGILGKALRQPWKLVNLPFNEEYPGGRQWNQKSAQLAIEPITLKDDEQPIHPTWDLILSHCGQDLDAIIPTLEWCKEDGIHTGADYLLMWAACMFRCPFEHLPYLFFFGPENSGKSIFHEELGKLMTRGVAQADKSLTNKSDFNGELENAILCVVEERDISRSPGAHAKIKEWVTAPNISIRRMRTDAFSLPNTTHWIQCANDQSACPIFPGDTRITMIYVPLPAKDIAKPILQERLKLEAPHFMRRMLDLELPKHRGRLRLPIIKTVHKARAEEINENPLMTFLAECVNVVPDATILFSDFYKRFDDYLQSDERHRWTRKSVAMSLPQPLHTKRGAGNKMYLINADWKHA